MIGTSCFWRHETTIPLGSETFAMLMARLIFDFSWIYGWYSIGCTQGLCQ
jgi:hypothetical protein